ncbi:hypothetical protein [Chroogloeocystis siderophila]|jgi:hypothetical protein|nr:hypothetical protein [Chroogloeocystis siderophila]
MISTTAKPTEQSDEESDTAVRLFGCDSLICINAVRQSRGLPPVT